MLQHLTISTALRRRRERRPQGGGPRERPSRRLAGLLPPLLLLAACGHTIRPEFAPNYASQGGFDFKRPPCRVSPAPELAADEVGIRYLGAGGLYVEWRGTALLLAPYFSNPRVGRFLAGRLITDEAAVRRGLGDMNLTRVRAVAAGHSHYDHLGDLPRIAETYTPGARIYVNTSGAHALAPVPALAGRVASLEGREGWGWIPLRDVDANELPFRFRKVASAHAPHFWGVHLAAGGIEQDWTGPWESHRLRELREGHTFAFVIDLLAAPGGPTLFRIYYQDAMSPPGTGIPRLGPWEKQRYDRYDLAVLCMASYNFVRHQPETILGALRPRHVLVTHYEDFFRDTRKPVRFVFLLTDFWANRFFHRMRRAMSGWETAGPQAVVCGPSSRSWTMPIPGEWVRFRVAQAP
jgi:hypothetical protein